MSRRVALAASAVAGVLALATAALGFWTGSVTGSGGARAGVLPAGEAPSAAANGSSVAVTWPQSTLPRLGLLGAIVGGGYVLTRYAEGSSAPVAPGLSCGGVKAGAADPLACTELGVPEGRWQYTVSTRLQSWIGAEGSRSPVVAVDFTPPVTTLSLAPPANAAGWHQGDVTAALTADDGPQGSGVSSITYGLIGAEAGPPTAYAAPFALSAEGVTTVSYGAVDVSGNAETARTADVRIDRTPPSGAVTAPATGAILSGAALVAAAVADALSGVASARFEVSPAGEGAWSEIGTVPAEPYEAPFDTTMLAEGAYELRVAAEDLAGNSAESAAVAVVVDNLLPAGLDVQGANGGVAGTLDAGDTVTVTFSEPMLASSLLAGWDGSTAPVQVDVGNGRTDRLEIAGVELGRVFLGTRDAVRGRVRFAATLSRVGPATFELTLGACTTWCLRLRSGVGPTTYEWRPSAGATDLAGNGASTATVTQSGAPAQNL